MFCNVSAGFALCCTGSTRCCDASSPGARAAMPFRQSDVHKKYRKKKKSYYYYYYYY